MRPVSVVRALQSRPAPTVRVCLAAFNAIGRMSREAAPNEGCAFLVGRSSLVEAVRTSPNLHPQPATRYHVDPEAFLGLELELEGTEQGIIGIVHSHPFSEAAPSPTDRAHALPGWLYLIHGFPPGQPRGVLRAWRLAGEPLMFRELPCLIED